MGDYSRKGIDTSMFKNMTIDQLKEENQKLKTENAVLKTYLKSCGTIIKDLRAHIKTLSNTE